MEQSPIAIAHAHQHSLSWPRFWLPLLLVAGALITRLPFQSQMLYHWDSVNFALALVHFDIAQGQPHAPGYPLYVVLGHLAAQLAGSAQAGYVLMAIVGSALTALAIYELGRAMWNTSVGLIAALFMLSSPLFWFYGEIALPHTLDAMVVVVTALLCWHLQPQRTGLGLLLAVWLGLIGGFRQQTMVFMFPLALWAWRQLPPRWLLTSLVVCGLIVLGWAIPLFMLSGGIEQYLSVVAAYSASFNRTTSILMGAGFAGISHNTSKLARYTLWATGFTLLPLAAGLWSLRTSWRGLIHDRRMWFLVIWAAPCLLFYTFIHMGQQGLIFVYLPILMLLGAAGSLKPGTLIGRGIVFACVLGNALLFLITPAHLAGDQVKVLSYATIKEQDELLKAQIALVHEYFPADAVLLSDQWRFPQYYLPEVTLIPYTASTYLSSSDQLQLSALQQSQLANAHAIAWYEDVIDRFNQAPDQTENMGANRSLHLRILRRSADERFVVTAGGIGLAPAATQP